MGSFGPCVEIPGSHGEFGAQCSHFMDEIYQATLRHQRCFTDDGVGDGVLGKCGASGHHCDVLADWQSIFDNY